jgi:hypothetical protein
MSKRVEIYPNIRMAKMAFDEKVQICGNNLKGFDKRNLTVYNFDGEYFYFFGNIYYLRGHRFDEIYIHPNVKHRKKILEGTFIDCKIVYKI